MNIYNKEIKLVALDLDGTIVNKELKITPPIRKKIKELINLGVKVVLASGRMYLSAHRYAKELCIKEPLITYEGALIKEVDYGRTLHSIPLPINLVENLLKLANSLGITATVYDEEHFYTISYTKEVAEYERISGLKAIVNPNLSDFLPASPLKVIFISLNPQKIKELYQKFLPEYNKLLHLTISQPIFLEFLNLEASKGKALEWLCNYLNIPLDYTMAIGDNLNDKEMLLKAGIGVAMGNATAELKEIANYVVGTIEEDGVLEALEMIKEA